MAKKNGTKFSMPRSSWETLKKIVRAYYAKRNEETPTVEAIAEAAGIHRPVVSMNNNFLKYIGVVEEESYRLTQTGTELATGLVLNNKGMYQEALRKLIRAADTLKKIVDAVQARGEVRLEDLRAQVILTAELDAASKQALYIKTLIDMLQDSGLIETKDDLVRPLQPLVVNVGDRTQGATSEPTGEGASFTMEQTAQAAVSRGTRMPLPLGPGRLAYIELPRDWTTKDLPRLLKLLELSLGEGEE